MPPGGYYALFYMQTILKINSRTANIVVALALLLGMPFFTVVGALSDRIGRKKLMMAGCLLAVLTYIPIYQAMERAAGNNVITVKSARNKITGAISLTPLTTDASGTLVPAKDYKSQSRLASGTGVHPGDLRLPGLRPDRRIPHRSLSGESALHFAVIALPHRQRRVRRTAPRFSVSRPVPPPVTFWPASIIR